MILTSTPRQRRRAVAARAEAQPTAAVSWMCGVCQFENDAEGEGVSGRCGMCGADGGGGGSEEQVMAAARGASNRSVRSAA